MGSSFLLFWYLAILKRYISRFGEFYSRLGQRKFPFSPPTGIYRQGIDFTYRFRERMAFSWAKSAKFPSRREKPGILSRRPGPRNNPELLSRGGWRD